MERIDRKDPAVACKSVGRAVGHLHMQSSWPNQWTFFAALEVDRHNQVLALCIPKDRSLHFVHYTAVAP